MNSSRGVAVRRSLDRSPADHGFGYALNQFFQDINENDFVVWGGVLHHLKSACERKDLAAIIQYDLAFHRSILKRGGVPALSTIWQTIVARIRRHFLDVTSHYGEDLLEIYEQHRRLVEIIRTGNRETAVKALEEHIW
jgi:GntR family transcriptional regulator, rspAB operon transcriptional repressor